MGTGVGLHWFRKALRLHDNPALSKVIESSYLIPLYILDTEFLDPKLVGSNRLGFLLDSLRSLDDDLREKGSCLFVAKGKPLEVMDTMIKEFQVKQLSFERDTEPYNKQIDVRLITKAKLQQVNVETDWGHTLYDPNHLLELNDGKTPLTMSGFMRVLSMAGDPAQPLKAPKQLPPPPPMDIMSHKIDIYNEIPTLSDLKEYGYLPEEYTTWFSAGEQVGITRMENFLAQKGRVDNFDKPNTNPTAIEPDTTALSPYLTRGSLSVRLLHSRLQQVASESCTRPPVSLEGQLYWREMAYLIGYTTPNFNQMVDNPICIQIPWRDGENAQVLLDKWEMGKTGYPAVDASMNQLRTDGWIHHLGRHLVACFLTRGDLWVHWEMGRSIFDRRLIDADWSITNFQWHWLSCSAFFHQYFRCYGPTTFYRKWDPTAQYIRKHVPILANYPDQYIYAPWEAPRNVQEEAGCIIGKDYPKPIVDHKSASKDNMRKMKAAYDQVRQINIDERQVENSMMRDDEDTRQNHAKNELKD